MKWCVAIWNTNPSPVSPTLSTKGLPYSLPASTVFIRRFPNFIYTPFLPLPSSSVALLAFPLSFIICSLALFFFLFLFLFFSLYISFNLSLTHSLSSLSLSLSLSFSFSLSLSLYFFFFCFSLLLSLYPSLSLPFSV